jgi:predicted outer membrane repeat protein
VSAISDDADTRVESCTFEDNTTGVATATVGDPTINLPTLRVKESTFSRNTTAVAATSDLEIEASTFTSNEHGVDLASVVWFGETFVTSLQVSDSLFSAQSSSAIRAWDAVVAVTRTVFEENTAADAGGAIAATSHHGFTIDGNLFTRNTAPVGGAIALTSPAGDTSLLRNWFCANVADTGGGVSEAPGDLASGALQASGNVFAGNVAASAGGGLHLQRSAVVVNNTFVDGDAASGGAVWSSADLDFRNNIVAYTSGYGLYGGGGTATIAYNDFWDVAPDPVGGSWPAPDATNLAVDPRFVSYAEGGCEGLDLALADDSPLRDAGDPSTSDTDGGPADIGATGGKTPVIGRYDPDPRADPEPEPDIEPATRIENPIGVAAGGNGCVTTRVGIPPWILALAALAAVRHRGTVIPPRTND